MIVVIPMAGASSRFYNAGYKLPKYMLPVKQGVTLFDMTMMSFNECFKQVGVKFIFVVRNISDTVPFVKERCNILGIVDYEIFELKQITKGQAETVLLGLQHFNLTDSDDSLIVFNIDTIRNNIFKDIRKIKEPWDTLLDAFYDENPDESKWSFAKVEVLSKRLLETAEKKKISNYCSTGLYIFNKCKYFTDAYLTAVEDKGYDYYVAPLYNYLDCKENYLIECDKDNVVFSGVPEEYEELVAKYK